MPIKQATIILVEKITPVCGSISVDLVNLSGISTMIKLLSRVLVRLNRVLVQLTVAVTLSFK